MVLSLLWPFGQLLSVVVTSQFWYLGFAKLVETFAKSSERVYVWAWLYEPRVLVEPCCQRRQRAKLQKVGDCYLACARYTKACIAYLQYARIPRLIFVKSAGTQTFMSRCSNQFNVYNRNDVNKLFYIILSNIRLNLS